MPHLEYAISIRQPWVELILLGKKKAENRSSLTKIRGRVFLYAARMIGEDPAGWRATGKEPGTLPVGKIVGSVEIVGCRWDQHRHAYAYTLHAPRRIRPHRVPTNQPAPRF